MLREGFRYPFEGRPGYGTVLGGAALWVLALLFFVGASRRIALLVPGIATLSLLVGYQLRVADAVFEDPTPPAPRFGAWAPRIRDGFVAVLLIGGAFVPTAALFWFGFALRETVPTAAGLSFLGGVIVVLFVSYLLPASLTVFATTGSPDAALDPGRIAAIVNDESYAVAWVLGSTVRLFGLLLIPLIVGILLWFSMEVASTYIYVRGVRQAGGRD